MLEFLRDIVKRFLAKSPKFFRIVKIIGLVASVITGVPALLQGAGVDLPDAIDVLASEIVSIASLVASFIASLTVEDPEEAQLKIK